MKWMVSALATAWIVLLAPPAALAVPPVEAADDYENADGTLNTAAIMRDLKRDKERLVADKASGAWDINNKDSCAQNDAKACTAYGAAVFFGTPQIKANTAEGLGFFVKGCAIGSMTGCRGVGLAKGGYFSSDLPLDPSAARAAFTKGCDGNDAQSCLYLGKMIGRGAGGPKSVLRGFEMISKACTLGDADACKLGESIKARIAAHEAAADGAPPPAH